MVNICNVNELEERTGICPRDSWWSHARNGKVYFVKHGEHITAFLYKCTAINFIKGLR